jgi:DNA-binding transcriptional MocR family regulator
LAPFHLPLDRRSPEPIFRQICKQIKELVDSGRLPAGTRLPPTRDMARDLRVNRATVRAAYDALSTLGYVAAGVGQGTFVLEPPDERNGTENGGAGAVNLALAGLGLPGTDAPPATPFGDRFTRFSRGVEQLARFPHRERLVTDHPEPVDFAALFPDETYFPVQVFRQIVHRLLIHSDRAREVLQYAAPQGDPVLRAAIARELSRSGARVSEDDIIVVNGTQQGIDLLLRLFVDPGDHVLIESPTYSSILPALGFYGAQLLEVPMTPTGLDLNVLSRLLTERRPKLLYTMPSFHNPTGISQSLEKRRALLELVRRHELPLIEDDYEKDLGVPADQLPSLKALDPDGLIMHLGSFSKGLFPGLRLGYIAAPAPVIERLTLLKRYSDLHTSSLTQAAVAEFLNAGHYDRHLKRLQSIYGQRRAAILSALERHLPPEVNWTRPEGGYALWVTLPPSVPALELLAAAREEGVIFTPGSYFFAQEPAQNGFRLSVAHTDLPAIERGAEVLGRLIRQQMGRLRTGALTHV